MVMIWSIDSSFEFFCLIRNTGSSVDCHNSELIIMVLQFGEFVGYLNCQLTSWSKNNRLNFTWVEQFVFTKIFDGWKTEGQSLTGSCKISGNKILSVVDWVEAVLLDWEQALVSLLDKHIYRLRRYLRIIRKVTVCYFAHSRDSSKVNLFITSSFLVSFLLICVI